MGSITDVGGILVGHHHRIDPDVSLGSGWASGSTVVLTPPGTVGAVDGRGGAPGTRETDLLDPINTVRHVDAVVLTGGSAYGLAAADGVMTWLEEQGRGVAMDGGVVPIVPAAVIFDLPVGGWANRPTAEFGYAAAAAAGTEFALGTVGGGVGARAGVLKGGVGTASVTLDCGVTVGALVVLNAAGDVVDPATGLPWMASLIEEFGLIAPPADQLAGYADRHREIGPLNTTIAVVATDAALSPAGCRRMAVAAHDGLARTIQPCHTPLDGDTVFALATGAITVEPDEKTPVAMSPETALVTRVGAAAADCLARAVLVGLLAAEPVAGIPTYRDMLPGAFE
ncbi:MULTISPECIES: P1 family peptidase [unclassified Mycolicibacterium]|uniref:P1 family peptidase n=1 Tax=unclassified Mycolicibacterium TaxID=2636767 RepID=UPI0012DF965D|nr:MULTISPECIES: P1 family peptidase [unclassified Mycolicibacterium]MUL83277.1 P1 family peptidase [Mycolicibacterium sp. CBMA 329]MUL90268.1 P1 family peptidase [Mycolicibacterium sp. CBMA 331]MUM00242.1 P1 family peptidase [Mycolicibacterium sp. CBMA 334]MUM26650.1 P1 family peptidase [Mycolicibacterium sp. CBMA 295]MUM41212.1 P1 family peptidase [Mycolicibacterium sp. CBMA 247]